MHYRGTYTHFLLLGILAASSLWLDVTIIHAAKSLEVVKSRRESAPVKPLESYTFVGSDRPQLLPVTRRPAKMVVEESVHYSLTNPEAFAEWLWTAPIGDNHIRLGPDKRAFAVAMFHELHCLRGMRVAMERGLSSLHQGEHGHMRHCFNYLRQWILCSADVTLEPGDFKMRNFTTNRVGSTYTCRNWEEVYEIVNEKWYEWEHFRKEHNVPEFVE